jgi:anti-sigma regulatory factor (Ser/Thr protein kinase)
VVTRFVRADRAPVSLRVPFAASSVALARQQLKDWMRAAGSPRDCIEDARVVISELVGNSVRHAQPLSDGTILVTWAPERRGLRISVTDGGSPSRPRKVNAASSALDGRGMAIVETLAEQWWSERTRSRSTVSAVIRLA